MCIHFFEIWAQLDINKMISYGSLYWKNLFKGSTTLQPNWFFTNCISKNFVLKYWFNSPYQPWKRASVKKIQSPYRSMQNTHWADRSTALRIYLWKKRDFNELERYSKVSVVCVLVYLLPGFTGMGFLLN